MVKTPDTPSLLYKYVPPERLEVLSSLLIRYTPLGAFNDPFEGRPSVSLAASHREARRDWDRLEDAHRMLHELVRASISFEVFKAYYPEHDFPPKPGPMPKLDPAQICEFLDQRIGVLSLSEVPDSHFQGASR